MTDQGQIAIECERYERAAKRVQTAIAAVPAHPNQTPKHMRTGIDLSKSDMAGLAKLLMSKGVITEIEYLKAMADEAEEEAARYEDELSTRFGINIITA